MNGWMGGWLHNWRPNDLTVPSPSKQDHRASFQRHYLILQGWLSLALRAHKPTNHSEQPAAQRGSVRTEDMGEARLEQNVNSDVAGCCPMARLMTACLEPRNRLSGMQLQQQGSRKEASATACAQLYVATRDDAGVYAQQLIKPGVKQCYFSTAWAI